MSDADLVERLYCRFQAEGVNVWWYERCLPAGQPWEQGFADGLSSSSILVFVLSKAALAPCLLLTCASACDNLVLEYQLAPELHHCGVPGGLLNHSMISGVEVDAKKTGLLQMSLSRTLRKNQLRLVPIHCDVDASSHGPSAA